MYSHGLVSVIGSVIIQFHVYIVVVNCSSSKELTCLITILQIVAGCKGLPLALKVIGSSLRGESLRKWRRTEQMLLKGGQIFKEHKALLDVLGTSLISLEQNLKECFMDLGLFPEDEKIPATSVIDMWIEVRGFDEDDAYVALVELSRRNLFTLIERTRYFPLYRIRTFFFSISSDFIMSY